MTEKSRAVLERLRKEQRSRWADGDRVSVEELLGGQSGGGAGVELALICSEFHLREQRGEVPDAAEYFQRYPQHVAELQQLIDRQRANLAQQMAADSSGVRSPAHSGETDDSHTGQSTAGWRPMPGASEHDEQTGIARENVNRVLGNYELLEKLGAGGMGEVYRAVHTRMERVVAVKVLPERLVRDEAAVLRFQQEVKAAARLSHPNVVTAHDADEADGVHFLVMEYTGGIDLQALVKKFGSLTAAEAVDCVLQAARGLEYAHGQGVLHRDIKPANLLFDSGGTVRLLDLGLARFETDASGEPDAAPLTQTGVIMGTVDYMSPEQADDSHTADARSDIYSLGCTLHYLVTGRPPYSGDTMLQRILAHRNQPQPDLPAEIPAALNTVFRQMIARHPDDRFQGMSEVIAALEECRATEESLHDTEPLSRLTGIAPAASPARIAPTSSPSRDTLNNTSYLQETVRPQTAASPQDRRLRRWWPGLIPLLAAAVLAGLVLRLRTPAGTVLVEVDDPAGIGAVVSIDEQQQITITGEGEVVIRVAADGQRHTLRVTKGGFETFTEEFTIGSGETRPIRVRLEPEGVRQARVPSRKNSAAAPRPLSLLERNRRAAEAVRQDGGGVDYYNLTSGFWHVHYPTGVPPRAETLKLLADVPGLLELNLPSSPNSPEDMQLISGMKQLTRLRLPYSELGDDEVNAIGSLQHLTFLELHGNREITDASCSIIADLPQLRFLAIGATAVTDEGLAVLAESKGLQELWLTGDRISKEGLAHLSGLPELTRLRLDHCPLRDTAVPALSRISTLSHIDLRRTGVTASGIEKLQGMLPDCVILHESRSTRSEDREAARQVLEHGGMIKAYPDGRWIEDPDRREYFTVELVQFDNSAPLDVWRAIGHCPSTQAVAGDHQEDLDECLRHLAGCRGLTQVAFGNCLITWNGLLHLTDLPRLEILQLHQMKITESSGLAGELNLPRLETLHLGTSRLDDELLRKLTLAAPNLHFLNIYNCGEITSAGMTHVNLLSSLRHLGAMGTSIDDEVVPLLAEMKQLRMLSIAETRLTAAGVARLRRALPECLVIWDDNLDDALRSTEAAHTAEGKSTPAEPKAPSDLGPG